MERRYKTVGEYHNHKDFEHGGLLHHSINLEFNFPANKKEKFLNYMLLVHSHIKGAWLAHYATLILNYRWAEAEPHIFDEIESSHNPDLFSFIRRYIQKFNLTYDDLPHWVVQKLADNGIRFIENKKEIEKWQ